jgi:hypothetical protein
LHFRPLRAILPALVRRLAATALALCAALGLGACGNPCQDLGDRLCGCSGSGTAKDTCKQQVKNQLSDAGMDGADEAFCSEKLGTCNAPAGADFCEWLNTQAAKVACGLAFPPAAASFQAGP